MKFIIGENGWTWLERATYRGAIGVFYNNTLGGIASYIIFGIIILLAVIGLFTVLRWIVLRKKKKKDPGEEWLKTGKYK